MIVTMIMATVAIGADPGYQRVTDRAKTCIRTNVAEVERSEPSLAAAADFLLDDVCAVPVHVRERYAASLTMVQTMRRGRLMSTDQDEEAAGFDAKTLARMKSARAKQVDAYQRATISEETGEVVVPEGIDDGIVFMITSGSRGRQSASPDLRSFTADALLDARKARQAR